MTLPSATTGPRPLAPAPPSHSHDHHQQHHHHLPLRSSLERLPNELLLPIAEALAPAPPLTTRFALRVSGTWEFHDADHQWADFLAAHRSLLAFAQASQRTAAIAKPLLYHTLVIPTPRVLVTLIRRMNQRPEIRPWIRSVTCLANVAGSVTVDETHGEWQRQTGGRAFWSMHRSNHHFMLTKGQFSGTKWAASPSPWSSSTLSS